VLTWSAQQSVRNCVNALPDMSLACMLNICISRLPLLVLELPVLLPVVQWLTFSCFWPHHSKYQSGALLVHALTRSILSALKLLAYPSRLCCADVAGSCCVRILA
jgi:hypothetical protein